MAQILQAPPTWQESLAGGLGQGFSSGLQKLADMKLQELSKKAQRQEQSMSLKKLYKGAIPGLSDEQAEAFASAPDFVHKALWKNARFEGFGEPSTEGQSDQQGAQEQQIPEQQFGLELLNNLSPEQTLNVLQSAQLQKYGQQSPQIEPGKQILLRDLVNMMGQSTLSKVQPQQQVSPEQIVDQLSAKIKPIEARKKEVKELGNKENISSPQIVEQKVAQQQASSKKPLISFTNPKEKAAAEKAEADKWKFNKEDIQRIVNNAKEARDDLKDLERFEELEDSGKLDTPGYIEFLKRSGLDIPALMNPESEEFQKIANNFVRNAKSYYGSRISNFEVEQFLKTIPSLSQSPEGRKRVIANLKYLRRGTLEYNDSLREVLNENRNIPPYDLLLQIDKKSEKRLDDLAKKFKEDLKRPVPKGQNKYITALQAGLGTVASRIPKALAGAGIGAATGARLGSIAGVPGALVGGGLGGLAGLTGLGLRDIF